MANRETPQPAEPPLTVRTHRAPVSVIGIGLGAGGPQALESFLCAAGNRMRAAFVVATALESDGVRALAARLDEETPVGVEMLVRAASLRAGHVYLLPARTTCTLHDGGIAITDSPGPEPQIDALFLAMARLPATATAAVILSGQGTGGSLGIHAVRAAGGLVVVQEPASAPHGSMPRAALATGAVNLVLSPAEMPARISSFFDRLTTTEDPDLNEEDQEIRLVLPQIYRILIEGKGHDFSAYKPSTICRRIQRRMSTQRIAQATGYLQHLRENAGEADILFDDLLIGVTRFFRDPEAFAVLAEDVLPRLLEERQPGEPIRVWIPGCATGEEAYSMAILLHEAVRVSNGDHPVSIFATDIAPGAIETARAGAYPEIAAADIGEPRLSRYFDRAPKGRFRAKKVIREMLVFAPHSLLKDPPFTRLDLLCCRNVLIYLDAPTQRRLLSTFYYSLRPGGTLFLGTSETIGQSKHLFESTDRKWKIYRRNTVPALDVRPSDLNMHKNEQPIRLDTPGHDVTSVDQSVVLSLVEALLKQSDAPPCAVINARKEVVYIHGRTGRFLEPAQGQASLHLIDMIRPGLRARLAAAIRDSADERRVIELPDVKVDIDADRSATKVVVTPLRDRLAAYGLTMISFVAESHGREDQPGGSQLQAQQAANAEELQLELLYTRENLNAALREMEAANAELSCTNEELQSTNEELQSTNEELETSKEELHSLNEEASTANAELQGHIDQISRTNDDLKNVLEATRIATIFLDPELCIRRFTATATAIVPMTEGDVGRPIRHLVTTLVDTDVSGLARAVLEDLAVREIQTASADGHDFLMRLRPYRTAGNVIDGVVITFDDITTQVATARRSEAARWLAESVVAAVEQPLVILDSERQVETANRAFCRLFGLEEDRILGYRLDELDEPRWSAPGLAELLDRARPDLHDREHTRFGEDYRVEALLVAQDAGADARLLLTFNRQPPDAAPLPASDDSADRPAPSDAG